jgi:Spy/CpxP family protein refolding chaperone
MNARFLRVVSFFFCLLVATGASAFAQGRGGPGGGGPLPAGRGPNGPGGAPSPGSTSTENQTSNPVSSQANTSMRTGLQFGPVGRWWDDKSVGQSIGLRSEQKKKMDAIFNSNKSAIVGNYKAFLNEQSKLNALSKDRQADQARLFAAIDAVSEARASLQKATAQMLLQIRQQMDAQQIEKLEKLK